MTMTSTQSRASRNRISDNLRITVGILEDLPLVVLDERRRRDITLRVVAEETGIAVSHIFGIERGTTTPSVRVAVELLEWAIQSRKLRGAPRS